MVRVNLVVIAVLSAAVIGTGVFLSLERSPATPAEERQKEIGRLIRRLGDSDVDVRRDAEAALKKFGAEALIALKTAVDTGDEVLAPRALSLVRQIEGAPVAQQPPATPERAPETPVAAAAVELSLECAQGRVTAGEAIRCYVRLRNGLPQPVLVARHRLDPAVFYGEFASFEIVDDKGAVTVIPVDVLPRDASPELEIASVPPAQIEDLFPHHAGPQLALSAQLSRPGTYRVRIVYDATEGSAYQQALAASHVATGAPLPPARLVSNEITIVVE